MNECDIKEIYDLIIFNNRLSNKLKFDIQIYEIKDNTQYNPIFNTLIVNELPIISVYDAYFSFYYNKNIEFLLPELIKIKEHLLILTFGLEFYIKTTPLNETEKSLLRLKYE